MNCLEIKGGPNDMISIGPQQSLDVLLKNISGLVRFVTLEFT